MPRLLSSYAANKRVEDGLRRKQEQIRLDYVRATHRHVDETEKLVDELIQINVRTPSAFETSRLPSANYQQRRLMGSQQQFAPANGLPQSNLNQHNVQMFNMAQQQGSTEQLAILKSRSRTFLTQDATTDDSMSMSRKEVPLPIVQVRGKEVFYQYETQKKSNWKKLEPSYRTKILLQRNDTVSNALRQFSAQRNQELHVNNELMLPRNSNVSLHESDIRRRSSLFSRRGSRKDSRVSTLSEDEYHAPPLVELKPQLSPGHTPRMLDGWTIMNWCLWNKQQSKPVWATKRYMDKKIREFKRFQATRTAHKKELPAKPSSANSTTREARRESIAKQTTQANRAKSVPAHKVSITIEEEEEDEDENEEVREEEEEDYFPEHDRGVFRPTTSILRRLPKNEDVFLVEENRPKTTQTHRRIALDTFASTPKERFNPEIIVTDPGRTQSIHGVDHNTTSIFRMKSDINEGKSVKICAPLQQDEDAEESEIFHNNRIHRSDSIKHESNRNKSQRLAATEFDSPSDMATVLRNPQFTPAVSIVKPVKLDRTPIVHGTPVLPKV